MQIILIFYFLKICINYNFSFKNFIKLLFMQKVSIKAITITNFKSYKGTHTISNIDNNFNVIVGPNGSGKSNIVDAIQFLFGYRAKKMRHTSSTNLINDSFMKEVNFENKNSGNIKNKKKAECSVSIIFNNSTKKDEAFENLNEFEDLKSFFETLLKKETFEIKRKLVESGKSTYYVNEKEVSFAILSSFLNLMNIDTQTNRFLILQGEIEHISLLKPKGNANNIGLLEYFEQIIGTAKFNSKIEDLENKFEFLSQDFETKTSAFKFSEKEFEYVNNIYTKEEVVLNKRKRHLELILEINSQRNTIHEHQKKVNKKEGKVIKERISVLKKEAEENKKFLEKLTDEENSARKILEKENEKNRKQKNLFGDVSNFLDRSRRKYNEIIERNEEIKTQNSKNYENILKYETELSEVKEKLSKIKEVKIKKSTEENLKRISNLQKEINSKKSKNLLIENKKEEFQKICKEINLNNLKNKELDLKEFTDKLENNLKEKNITLKEKDLENINSEILKKENENKNKTIEIDSILRQKKAILNSSHLVSLLKNIPGVHGRLGDLFSVPEELRIPFISAVKGSMDSIVVDKTETAQKCIKILQENKKRASFHVLEKINSQKIYKKDQILLKTKKEEKEFEFLVKKLSNKNDSNKNYKKIKFEDGNEILIPKLEDFIHTKPEYLKCLTSALKNTFITPNMEISNLLSFKNQERTVCITGEVIEKSGIMSKNLRGKINTIPKNRNCDLQNCFRCKNSEIKSPEIKSTSNNLSVEISDLESSIKKINSSNFDLQNLRNEIKKVLRIIYFFQSNSEILKTEAIDFNLEKVEEEIRELKSKLPKENVEKQKLLSEKFKIESCIHNFKIGIKSEIEFTNLMDECEFQLSRISKGGNKEVYKDKENKNISVPEILKKLEKELEKSAKDLEKYSTNNEVLKDQHSVVKDRINSLKDKLKVNYEEDANLNEQLKSLNVIYKPILINDLEEMENALKSKLMEIRYIISEEFSEEISENKKVVRIPFDDLKASEKKKCWTLKNSDDELPNYKFLNDYEIKKKEFEETTEKYSNFKKTYEKNFKELQELKDERKNLFMKEFERISRKFKEIYRTITFGGNAEIELIDYLDPFEGLVLSVMPPKKSWRQMEHLSGGEKTLTSLALVFAMQHVCPAPFYVMDEIDAALDFRNVSIIANFLKTIDTQFLIVSLRNDMIELGNKMIGVYKTEESTNLLSLNVS